MSSAVKNKPYIVVANIDEITHDQWLEIRQTGIGGSDAGAIAGLSKYRTPLSVYMDKIGQGKKVEENEPMYWGNVLEEIVAQEFAKRSDKEVARFPFLLRSKQYPWMLANVDRMVLGEEEGLECKTAHANLAKKWDDGMVPEDYILQCYHYMIVTGLKKWHIAALIGGQKFVFYEIEYDDAIGQAIIKQEKEFWDMVKAKTPPSAWAEDVDLLAAIYSTTTADTINLDFDAVKWINQYNASSATEKQAVSAKDEAKARLCEMIGHNSKATCGDFKLSWTPTKTTRLDTDRIKKERPDLFEEFSKTSESRRFTLK